MPTQQSFSDLIPQIGVLILAVTSLVTAATAWLINRGTNKSKGVVSSTQATYIEAMSSISESFAKRIEALIQDKVDTETKLIARIQSLETKSAEQSRRLEIVEEQLRTEEEQLRTEQNEKQQLIEERKRLRRSVNSLNAKVAYLRRVIEENGVKVSTPELARIEEEATDAGD